MTDTIKEWKCLSSSEQVESWKKWNPYTDKGLKELLTQILESFSSEYPELNPVWGNVHGEYQIVVSAYPVNIPNSYLGVPIRRAPY